MMKLFQKGPSARQVAIRAVILAQLAGHAVSMPPRASLKKLTASWSDDEYEDYQQEAHARSQALWASLAPVRGQLTPLEREFFKADALAITERQQIDASWRIESLQTLLWALGKIADLPPYDRTVQQDLTAIAPLAWLGQLKRTARLRPRQEIEDERAIAALWHWRSQMREQMESGAAFPPVLARQTGLRTYPDLIRETARWAHDYGQLHDVIGEDFATYGKPYRDLEPAEWSNVRYITIERHHALSWLAGMAPRNRWHETPTEPSSGFFAAARGRKKNSAGRGKPQPAARRR